MRKLLVCGVLCLVACAGAPPVEEPAEVAAAKPEAAEPTEEVAAVERVRSVRQRSVRINIDVEEADLRDVMDQIGRMVGRNILVDRGVEETVTISLRDIPWRTAVDIIAKMTRCEVEDLPSELMLLNQPPRVTMQFD